MKVNRAPLRAVVRAYQSPQGSLLEQLDCGHTIETRRDLAYRPRKAKQRRCWKCAQAGARGEM